MGKIPKRRPKKFHYRRAAWHTEAKKQPLSTMVEAAHTKFSTVGERRFEGLHGSKFEGSRWKKDENGDIFLHLTLYYPGQPTSTVSNEENNIAATIEAHRAPDTKEFLDGDIFALIRKNHVILCCHSIREQYFDTYIRRILNKNEIDTELFYLDKIAKASKVKLINDEGVKEIILNSSLYKASIDEIEEKRVQNIIGKAREQLARIFATDPTLKEIRENENLNMQISIKYNGTEAQRNKKDPEFGIVGKKRLLEASNLLIENAKDDGFVIVTGSGNQISADDIRVSESFNVDTLGKSLDYQDAWGKLANYANQLEAAGVFAQ